MLMRGMSKSIEILPCVCYNISKVALVCMFIFTLLFTMFVVFLIPVYTYYYGVQNFLWLSDIGLFLTMIALWKQSVLVMSMAAVGMLAVELLWWVDFFAYLFFGINLINLAGYMFDSTYPLMLRAISLFHIVTPIVWILFLF